MTTLEKKCNHFSRSLLHISSFDVRKKLFQAKDTGSSVVSICFLSFLLTLVAGGTLATVRVDPPALSDSGDYNQWKNKVAM